MIPEDILSKTLRSHKNSRRRYHDIMLYSRGRRDGFISGVYATLALDILIAMIYFVFIY